MAVPNTHPVIRWWSSGSNSWWDVPVFLLVVVAGGAAGFGSFEAWGQGHWPLFALLAVVAIACLVAVAAQVLGEVVGYLLVALRVLSLPLMAFPKPRAWLNQVWDGLNKKPSK
ncbi:hypothetical protein ACFVVM_14715 [Nocardia sp. NPDC058176]|uniref:hypothetical protein n=1 Tax=Nocardia sp. NPDC058176 TaxID=3346368 RepID=UPI0036DDF4F5